MNFDARLAVVVLAAFASANAAATAVAVWWWRRDTAPLAPQDRAGFLFHLRLLPVVAAILWALLATVSFFFFESRAAGERVGLMLILMAACGAALFLSALARLVGTLRAHRRALAHWISRATPITLDGLAVPALAVYAEFPIVAVVGVARPRILIARSVIDACTADELKAVLDHERGHIARGDNLRRLLLVGLPDVLGWIRAGRSMDQSWHDAAEEVADEAPGNDRGDAGRMALASALIRVARLVPAGQQPVEIPASALYRGEPLESRVRRLLEPIPPRPRAPRRHQWLALAGVITLAVVLLNPIHELLEAAVTFLP